MTGPSNTQPVRRFTPSSVLLIVANLVPLYGVLVGGWRIFPLVALYWLENGVVGFFGILKILCLGSVVAEARKRGVPVALGVFMKVFFAAFFVVHFGGFMAGHGFFIVMLFGGEGPGLGGGDIAPGQAIEDALGVFRDPGFIAAALAMVFSHGWSLVGHNLRGHERDGANAGRLMGAAYKRVVVLHVFIIASGFLVLALGSPIPALVLFVALKTAVDLWAHRREHRKARAQAQAAEASPTDADKERP